MGSRRGAITAAKLVRHYGGKVVAFIGEEVELPNYVPIYARERFVKGTLNPARAPAPSRFRSMTDSRLMALT
jgi:hypothetical protein